jgi:N-acetylmuramoyl-L-alanine amidase
MSKKKKVVKKRRLKKSRLIILAFLLVVSVFLISFLIKNIFGGTSTDKVKNTDNIESNTKKSVEIEHLSLENEKSKGKIKILIDPGHGGSDVGARGVDGSLEKDISLEIGKKVAGDLSQYSDLEVILTRSEDTYVSLDERTKMANSQNVDLVVSIHQNAESGGNTAYGTETYYQKNDVDDSEKLAKSIQDTICLYLNTRNRGIYPSNLEVLRDTDMPSALVEVGFLTNKKEVKKLNNEDYQNKMAEGISQGILSYIDSKHK